MNEEEKTAQIIGYDSPNSSVEIPIYANQDFIITCIRQNSFQNANSINSISFSLHSSLQTIEKEAFCGSTIESLFIPASVTELQHGWSDNAHNLQKVGVSSWNKYYKSYDSGLFVVEKPYKLIFVSRGLKKVEIPPDIQFISPYAFKNSNVETIFIPSSVEDIESYTFANL